MGLIEGLPVEKARILPAKYLRPDIATHRVVGLVACNGGNQQHRHRQRQTQQIGPTQRADNEQQRVARQEGHDDQPGFDKHDQEQQGIDPGAVLGDKGFQVAIHMQDEVNEYKQEVHAPIIPALPPPSPRIRA